MKYLGHVWRRVSDGVQVRLTDEFWNGVLVDMYLEGCRPLAKPGEQHHENDTSPRLSPGGHALYRTVVGKLLLAQHVRPDISYTVKELARLVTGPTESAFARLNHLVIHVRGAQDLLLHLGDGIPGAEGEIAW